MKRREILEKIYKNEITVEEAEILLSKNNIEVVDEFLRFDIFREQRTGIPEIVYAETKSPKNVAEIVKKVVLKKEILLISRTTEKHVKKLKEIEESLKEFSFEYGPEERFCLVKKSGYNLKKENGKVGIITAGTSDIPVATEAKVVAEMMGCETILINDVGVAGLHRLFEPLNSLLKEEVDVLIVAAGMEGALPTVVAGLVDIPVIGLPISTGYGFGGKGQTALMSMLQTCALGLAVVNIDAGVSAGAFAAKIAKRARTRKN